MLVLAPWCEVRCEGTEAERGNEDGTEKRTANPFCVVVRGQMKSDRHAVARRAKNRADLFSDSCFDWRDRIQSNPFGRSLVYYSSLLSK
jgi:hypothetical protein